MGVQTSCLLDKPLPGMTVAYTSLQPMAAILNTSVLLRCSTGHPWTAGLLPDLASAAAPVTTLTNQPLLGLTYNVQVSAASGTGTGKSAGGGQAVPLGVTVPGGRPVSAEWVAAPPATPMSSPSDRADQGGSAPPRGHSTHICSGCLSAAARR